jgi:hypothetical protein
VWIRGKIWATKKVGDRFRIEKIWRIFVKGMEDGSGQHCFVLVEWTFTHSRTKISPPSHHLSTPISFFGNGMVDGYLRSIGGAKKKSLFYPQNKHFFFHIFPLLTKIIVFLHFTLSNTVKI